MNEVTSYFMDSEQAGREMAETLMAILTREAAVSMLVATLTELGVVVVYTDDTEARRSNPGLPDDTPGPL